MINRLMKIVAIKCSSERYKQLRNWRANLCDSAQIFFNFGSNIIPLDSVWLKGLGLKAIFSKSWCWSLSSYSHENLSTFIIQDSRDLKDLSNWRDVVFYQIKGNVSNKPTTISNAAYYTSIIHFFSLQNIPLNSQQNQSKVWYTFLYVQVPYTNQTATVVNM